MDKSANIKLFKKLLLFFILSLTPHIINAQHYRNLALEGGGIRGIAYTGAIAELEKHHSTDSIRNIAGTSVGAIVGAALSVGYTARELNDLLYNLKIQSFNDGRFIFFGGFNRMITRYGWYRGNALEHWIGDLIEAKTGSSHTTFLQLHQLALHSPAYKDLYVTATNISLQRPEVFSYLTYPNMEIKTAVRTSMSVPLYFSAVLLDSNGNRCSGNNVSGNCYAFTDGGLTINYPLALFDTAGKPNPSTLGLKLERPEQIPYFEHSEGIAPYRITTFRSYVSALYNLTIETLNRKWPIKDEASRTIYISTEDIAPKVRRISRSQKDILIQSGKRAATRFLSHN